MLKLVSVLSTAFPSARYHGPSGPIARRAPGAAPPLAAPLAAAQAQLRFAAASQTTPAAPAPVQTSQPAPPAALPVARSLPAAIAIQPNLPSLPAACPSAAVPLPAVGAAGAAGGLQSV